MPNQVWNIVAILIAGIGMVGCSTTPTPNPTPSSSFSYSVYVEASDSNEHIPNARVVIHVANKAPLDGFTDDNGFVRISFDLSYIDKPAVLIIEADGYQRRRQEIDLRKDMLPDFFQLDPITTSAQAEGIDFDPPPTQEPTEESLPVVPTPTPTAEPDDQGDAPVIIQPTDTPTPEPSPTPTEEPTSTPTPENPPPPPTPALGGQLAIPLLFGASHKVYVVDVNANVRGIIDAAQQPDFTRDGTRLILNGVGNDLNKLRLSDPTGKSWQEIGDPSLAGHSHPALSPDGTQVVYDDNTLGCGNWCLYTRAINDNQGEGAIVTAAGNRFIINDNPLYPLWTTNNRLIFRSCNTWAVAGGGGTCGIWSMQGNGGNPERLTEMAGIPTDVLDNLLLFTFQNDVYRLNIATGEVKQLTFDPANDGLAAISPDGNWVAFLSNRGGQLAVWYAGINGGTPQKMFDIPQQWGTLLPDGWFDERLSWAN